MGFSRQEYWSGLPFIYKMNVLSFIIFKDAYSPNILLNKLKRVIHGLHNPLYIENKIAIITKMLTPDLWVIINH